MPPGLRYDLSYVKGDTRLIEEVAKRFEFAGQSASSSSSEACFVGLHGIGGSGKSTICKLMVNYYWPSYPGKCVLLDLPKDGHKGTIAKRLGEVIQQLDGPRYNGSMKRGRDFDQVLQELKEKVGGYDVFIAMDNVWESSCEEVERILKAGLTQKSKILITSRSEMVLKDLLERFSKVSVGSAPSIAWEEALELLTHVAHYRSFVSIKHWVDRVAKFGGSYHPLALKALGGRLKGMVCEDKDDMQRRFSELVSNPKLEFKVEEVIKNSLFDIPLERQHMFLDIVIVMLQSGVHRKADVHQWLSILYRDTHSSTQIHQHMRQLALDGLIHYEKISVRHFDTMSVDRYERVLVHDLYVDLATFVKANITDYRLRFCLREGSELTEVIQRSAYSEIREVREEGMLRRSDDFGEPPSFMFVKVVSCGVETSSLKSSEPMRYCGSRIMIVHQQQQDWSQLEVLVLKDCIIPQGLHLSKMRLLRALTLSDVRLKYLKGWRSATSLAVLKLKSCTPCDGRGQLEQLSGLANLRYLEVDGSGPWEGWPDLRRCGCLETLKIKNYIYSASQYSAVTVAVLLVAIFVMRLSATFIIRLPALSIYVFVIGITVILAGFGCHHMFFRSSTLPCSYNARLRKLELRGCYVRLLDLDGLMQLEELRLESLDELTKLRGLATLKSLRKVHVSECYSLDLKQLEDLRLGLPNLDLHFDMAG